MARIKPSATRPAAGAADDRSAPQVDPCLVGTPDEYRRAVDRAERGQP